MCFHMFKILIDRYVLYFLYIHSLLIPIGELQLVGSGDRSLIENFTKGISRSSKQIVDILTCIDRIIELSIEVLQSSRWSH